MEEYGKSQANIFKGLLIGSALGLLAGILFAPKSGKELRSNIKEKGSEILNDGKEMYANASTKAKEIIGEVKHQAKELKKETEGTGEKIAGIVQETVGQVKRVLSN